MGSLQQQSILKGIHVERGDDSIHELFRQTVSKYPNQIAIYYEDDKGEESILSYLELDEITNRLARVLRKYVKSNQQIQSSIAVCTKPTDRLPIVLLAILKAGLAYLPLDAEFPMTRIKHVLNEAQPLMVLIEDDADRSVFGETTTRTFDELVTESKLEQGFVEKFNENSEQIAIILYTSGSTGVPKGTLLPHATVLNRLQWQWRELPYATNEDRCIFKTALTFVDSVPEIWGPLLQGRMLIVVPKTLTRDPEKFVHVLNKHKIQRLVLVPSLLRSMLMYMSLQQENDILKSLRLWICSGESLPVSLAVQFFNTFGDNNCILANFYGSTEIMGDVTYHLLSEVSHLQGIDKIPIGRPLDNCTIYLVDKDLNLVPQGEIGEILVTGKNLAAGYIKDRDSHKFLENPHAIDLEYSKIFRTGDYGRIVKGGTLIYEGRVDSQIKVRGHRVDLAEVERNVQRAPDVEKAVVLCYKPGELMQTLISFVKLQKGTSISIVQIENLLQNLLPPYMLPRVIIVDHIPLLTNGKTDRQSLLKLYESSYSDNNNDITLNCDYTGVSKEDLPKARVLFPTIASVIGQSARAMVTLTSNFYELGGNSLNSIYTVTKLRDQGYQIGITEFITAKTMEDVMKRIKISTSDEKSLQEPIDEQRRVFEMLDESHKEDAINIITESFYSKADLEQWLMPDVSRSDYITMMTILWKPLVEKNLSFVVKSSNDGRTVAVGLNFDLWDEPELILDSKLTVVFDFLEYLEAPIRERKLPKGKGQIIHNFMMSTSSDSTPAENVTVMSEMEEYCLQLAKRKGYMGIFTTNTSPLTQQLGTDVFGYQTLLSYQVNKYIAPDNTKPFGKAPDTQLAICSLKMIE